MKKKICSLLAVLMVLSLAACGGGGKDASDSVAQTAPSAAPAENGGMEESAGWDAPMEEPEPESGGDGVPSGAKIIYTADMDLETKDFDAASQALADAVAEMGGYFESRSIYQGGVYRRLDCRVRVPVEHFTAFLDRAGESAHVTSRSDYQEDVSEAYYDSEARLTTQRTKLERLQELLSEAENMEDIITLEGAISETELQIEYLTGNLRQYDNRINYSTVTIYLREVYRLSVDEEVPVTFGERLAAAFTSGFHNGIDGLEDFAIYVARNWVGLLVLAAVAAAVAAAARRRRNKKRAAYEAAAAKTEAAEKKEEDKKE